MATTNLSMWRDRHWLNISNQLLHAHKIDISNFKDGLLIKETQNGEWLYSWLGRSFNDYSTTARETAIIRVVPPQNTSDNVYSLMLDITVRRHEATITARFPVPFGIIPPPPAAPPVPSTSAGPTTAETATAGPSSTAPTSDDAPGPSSSSSGKRAV